MARPRIVTVQRTIHPDNPEVTAYQVFRSQLYIGTVYPARGSLYDIEGTLDDEDRRLAWLAIFPPAKIFTFEKVISPGEWRIFIKDEHGRRLFAICDTESKAVNFIALLEKYCV